jgi:hypothetical protein
MGFKGYSKKIFLNFLLNTVIPLSSYHGLLLVAQLG